MKDPLYLLTLVLAVCFLALFGKMLMTDVYNEKALGILSTLIGGLITALSLRKKGEEKEAPKEPPKGEKDEAEVKHDA